jgi:hypothetical protein
MSITKNIQELKATLPQGVKLVAVSKFHPKEAVEEAYSAGQRVFGESRAQELLTKQKALPSDIEWHFIGPLQTNKVKEIAPFISLIQSADSLKLLNEIDKQGGKNDRVIDVLLEIHVAEEEAKHGFTPQECVEMVESGELNDLKHVRVRGIMGMATFTDDKTQIRREFDTLKRLFDSLKNSDVFDHESFDTLSMGMSQDYEIAIEAGCNMVRIGTDIFGEREY